MKKILKGARKSMIVVKNPGSTSFEEAYFIIREGSSGADETDMVKEAARIIEEASFYGKKKKKKFGWLWFLAGMLSSALFFLLFYLLAG